MKFKSILALAVLLLAVSSAQGQTSCPSGYTKAEGFKIQNPTAAAGTFVYPMCVSGTTGRLLFQGTAQLIANSDSSTSGDAIGFTSKPPQTVTTTGTLFGGQVSPRLNSGVAAGNIIGLHVDSYLKGTAAGTVSGDVRGMQIELVTDDAGTRTISGDVVGLRFRSAFSATTITGDFLAIKIEKPEAQTNSKTYTAVLELTSTIAGVWNNAPGTEPTTADGYLKIIVNGAVRYIQLYSGAPVD